MVAYMKLRGQVNGFSQKLLFFKWTVKLKKCDKYILIMLHLGN
jgi:hypothetical protein